MSRAYRQPVDPFAPPDAPGEGVPLRDYLATIGTKVKEVGSAWVVAEIESIKHYTTGSIFLVLVGSETRADGTVAKVASTSARIWKNSAPSILGWFEETTGRKLERGLTVLVKVSPDFHAAYGFNLTITDIDPRFTIGDMEARIAAIRKNLQDKGEFELNRALANPKDFTRVAVIAPHEGAGLADFRALASRLEAAGLCRFEYFTAVFQGADSDRSIAAQMTALFEKNALERDSTGFDLYDALVVIRGGGSRGDLDWLNNARTVRSVARFPLPVWVGIGHNTDHVLLDEVAHRSFDTPSKVVAAIADQIIAGATQALRAFESIEHHARRRAQHAQTLADTSFVQIGERARRAVERAQGCSEREFKTLGSLTMERVVKRTSEVDRVFGTVAVRARHVLSNATQAVARDAGTLEQASRRKLTEGRRVHEEQSRRLAQSATSALGRLSREVDRHADAILTAARQRVANAQRGIVEMTQTLETAPRQKVQIAGQNVAQWIRHVLLVGPQKTLQRGFAIVRSSDGKPVTRRAAAEAHSALNIEFSDGIVPVKKDSQT